MDFLNQLGFLKEIYYGNTLGVWLTALLVGVLSYVLMSLLQRMLVKRLARMSAGTRTDLDDFAVTIIKNAKFFFLFAISLYLASLVLTLPADKARIVATIGIISFLLQMAIWGNHFITFLANRHIQDRIAEDGGAVTTLHALSIVGRILLWTVIALLALDNVGVDVTALVAGLGIGGVAVALAVQNILGDLFASLSIVLDKPFVIGDFIIVGDKMGTVEHIGLKSTRVRSLSGEQIVFSNSELLKGQIRNYKRMFERRVVFSFGVVYQTPHAQLARIPGMVRELVEAQRPTRFDRAHFSAFGDSDLRFEVVYFVLSPDYNLYMDIQQAINLGLFKRFEEESIQFAHPTRTLHVETLPAPKAALLPAMSAPSDKAQAQAT